MKRIPIILIGFYKKFISPLFPATCRYYPSCSTYAIQAYERHGFFKGTILTVNRLLRCNPWSPGGIDHVPESYSIFKRKRTKGK